MPSTFLNNKTNKNLAIALVMAGFLSPVSPVLAQSSAPADGAKLAQSDRVQQIQSKIDDKKDNIADLDKQIQDLRNKLSLTAQEKKTLQNKVKELDLLRKNLAVQMQVTQIKANRTRQAVVALDESIKQKQAAIARHKQQIAAAISLMHQEERQSPMEIFLAASSISDAFDSSNRLSEMQSALNSAITDLQQTSKSLDQDKKEQEQNAHQLDQTNLELGAQKSVAEDQKAEQEALVKQTKNKEGEYQKLLAENLRRKEQFERELEQFQNDLQQEVDQTSFPKPGTRVFKVPVSGPITQHFGYNEFAKRAYASGHHSGTDFGVPTGTTVHASARGVVWAVGDTDKACRGASYGRYVLIKHPNGLATLYGHLSRPMVTEGQQVESGDAIALSGNTGYSTGPHVHVGLFVTSATKVQDVPSAACAGAVFHMPVAPKEGYMNFEDYL